MSNFDVILVGGGIANIMCAIKLANTDVSVCLIEQGNPISKRICPKDNSGKCINCKTCTITNGFGGAGFCSDCKLTYTHEVGGNVADYIGKEKFYELMDDVSKTFTKFGAAEEYVYNEEFANEFQYECSKYGMKLLKFPVRHLGTDGARIVMQNIWEYLVAAPNITIMCNTRVKEIDFDKKHLLIDKSIPITGPELLSSNFLSANYISIAVGRSGSEWLANECKKNYATITPGTIDIGVRVECPRSVTDKVTNNLYDFKVVYNSSTGNTCRTFCVNPGGYVVRENYDGDIACVNGHSLSDNKSFTTNFSILVGCHFTEPFNEPIQYGKSICRLANMLSDGKPMVQRLVDLQAGKRSTKDRMKRVIFEPTLTEAEPGDLRYVLPANIIDSILDFLNKLNEVMPGISSEGNSTILYAPECKFSSSVIAVDNTLQLIDSRHSGIYVAGDSAGLSRGIMQAAISGDFIAEDIKNKINPTC